MATHNRMIHDFCSYRGLLVLSGVAADLSAVNNPHLIRSDDGQAGLWAGAVDDVWRLGKPRGLGGPWHETAVRPGEASDPYLMTGYDRKTVTLESDRAVMVVAEVDPAGNGTWVMYDRFDLAAREARRHDFTEAFSAYWIRFTAGSDCVISVMLHYR